MSPGTFWALPHDSYISGTSHMATSTVMAPQLVVNDGTLDVLYVKRCKPRKLKPRRSGNVCLFVSNASVD